MSPANYREAFAHHVAEAERLLAYRDELYSDDPDRDHVVARAQVHATLAKAYAMRHHTIVTTHLT